MNEMNRFTENTQNTIIILREDYSHIIKKSDVWLVYTTKSHRPWVSIPNGVVFCDDGTISITLAVPNGGSYHA